MSTIRQGQSANRLFLLAGSIYFLCLLGLIYLYINVPADLTQFKYWAPRPHHSTEVASLYREVLGLPYHPVSEETFRVWNLSLLLGLFVSYGIALITARESLNWRVVFIFSAPIGIAASLIPPFYATDIFYYSITGEITGVYQENPYFKIPGEFSHSIFFPFNYWVDITSPYGPLWTSLSGWVVYLSQAHLFWTPMLFKVINLAALWGCAAIIQRIWHFLRPQQAIWGTILFLWNPLVLLDSIANGHNDVLMAFFLLLGALFLLKDRGLASFTFLLLTVWIKYLPTPIAAWTFLVKLRPGSKGRLYTIVSYAGVFAVLAVIVWLPHWHGLETLTSLFAESSRGLSGPIAFTVNLVSDLLAFEPIPVITILFVICFVLMLAWGSLRLYALFRRRSVYTPQDEIVDWITIFTWIVIVLPGAHPWYSIPLLALLAGFYRDAPRQATWTYIFFSFWFFYRAVAWS